MRERLIELFDYVATHLNEFKTDGFIKNLADYLLASGVIVPPCKVGDEIHLISADRVATHKVEKIEFSRAGLFVAFNWRGMGYEWINAEDFGKTVFLTKEEAEAALRKEGASE